MTAPAGAVFLSYASEDAEAAQQIAEALKRAGVEVWFDRNELRGGDTWDRAIREQIRRCRLFVPVISAHTESRDEGYFRREWNLATDRMHDMTEGKTFLLPLVIDDVREDRAAVPDRFRQVQWVRLPRGQATEAFVTRVVGLLGGPAPAAHPPNAAAPAPAIARAAATSRLRPALWLPLAAVLVIAVGAFLAMKARHAVPDPAATSHSAPVAAPTDQSIAVLPFVDLSAKHDKEYFGDGLAEELIDLLTRVPGLSVVARTSAFHFKNSAASIAEIGRTLNVAYVLEGSVREADSRLRITTQLIRTSDERHVFSRVYERPAADIFRVQDDIAGEVLTVLRVALADAPRVHSSTSWDAYQTYLEGKFSDSSRADTEKAIAAFRSALAIDDHFAPAWAALSYELTNEADSFGENPTKIYSEARQAAQRALTLDPRLVDGYLSMAYILAAYDYDFAGSEKLVQQAAQLEPGNARVMQNLGYLARYRGEWSRGIGYARRSIARDPLSAGSHALAAGLLTCDGRFAEAEPEYRRALELDPKKGLIRSSLAMDLAVRGQAEDSLAMVNQEPNEAYRLWRKAQILYVIGRKAESDQALAEYRRLYPTGNTDGVAWIYAVQGRLDEAFDWFNKAYAQHNQGLIFIKCMPEAPAFTADPRYKALLRKLNLPE